MAQPCDSFNAMDSCDARLWSEIIDRQIALQDMEASHDRLVRKSSSPQALRESKEAIRAAAAALQTLKHKAGITSD